MHASDQNGIVTIVQLQPISVVFTAPEEDVPLINKALAAGRVPVTALSSDGRRRWREGQLALRRQPGRPGERHDPAEGDLR